MSQDKEPSGALMGTLAVGAVGLCCGLPLLAASGAFAALAGIGLGSWLLIVAGLAVATWGVVRWRRRRTACEPAPDRQGRRDQVS